jgi:hypothetical protein
MGTVQAEIAKEGPVFGGCIVTVADSIDPKD